MSAPRVGDRVRVVLEGEVRSIGTSNDASFFLDSPSSPGAGRWYYADSDHVVSVEVIPKPLKVGDTIEGEQYKSAPVGTVAKNVFGPFIMRCANGQWLDSLAMTLCSPGPRQPRIVVYLPTEATT